jgi:DNA-binding transcriptional LysR family regulator
MEIKQLRYFLTVAEELHFTRAADKLGMAQPPLSQQISLLERQLGARLFIRNKRSVQLTAVGEAFLPYARRIINATEQATFDVKSIIEGKAGSLKVAAVFSTLYTFVPQILSNFRNKYPKIEVSLYEMTIANQLKALTDGIINVGILRGPFLEPNIDKVLLHRERFVAVLSVNHPLANREQLTLSEIARETLICLTPAATHSYANQVMAMLAEECDDLNIRHQIVDTNTLLALVGAGLGIAIVPASFKSVNVQQVTFREIYGTTSTSTVYAAWHKDGVSLTLPNFLETLREYFAQNETLR